MKIKTIALATMAISVSHTAYADQAPNQDTLLEQGSKNSSSVQLYGAEVYSHEKVLFGKFVIRMKMVSHPGVVSSFFTYDNESWQGSVPWREIDIEALGKTPNTLQTNLITGMANQRVHSERTETIPNLNDFHEYTLTWTPDAITWLLNGEMLHQELASKSQQVIDMRDSPQSYRMNIWISEAIAWVGKFDASTLPLTQEVDWIEYYRYHDGEFVLDWRDDFNSFDSKRWGKGDWTFDSNLVTFSQNNAYIENDKLILKLSK
ncbi:family 16 glycosylhydrolase [Vibrio sp. qd031]|uniref:family 16 glycosylhydrolase n=1 Tax=Vibrio sp. qd031 TaxID=1603038 RepID=UPI001F5B19BE|nr:family 16 glycosylhydrolase [Vibrio sp. qd031]